MNQILYIQKSKNRNTLEINTILKIFAIAIIVLGVIFIAKGTYGIVASANQAQIKDPIVSTRQVDGKLEIKISHNKIVDKVISALDHTLLNNTIVVPTAENISQFIWDGVNYELTEYIQRVTSHSLKNGGFKERSKSDVKLAMVKVWESEKCYAERVNSRIG